MYIIIKNDVVIAEVDSLIELSDYFNVTITEAGNVFFNNVWDTISYNMKEYTKEEALKDFLRTRLFTLINRYKLAKIYKAERL